MGVTWERAVLDGVIATEVISTCNRLGILQQLGHQFDTDIGHDTHCGLSTGQGPVCECDVVQVQVEVGGKRHRWLLYKEPSGYRMDYLEGGLH